jgi:hypothetical protein
VWCVNRLSIRSGPEKLIVTSNPSSRGQIEWTTTRMPDSRFRARQKRARTGLTLRHVTPFRVLYSNLAVAARELVESKAAKRKNFVLRRLLESACDVNLRELVDSFGAMAQHIGTWFREQ